MQEDRLYDPRLLYITSLEEYAAIPVLRRIPDSIDVLSMGYRWEKAALPRDLLIRLLEHLAQPCIFERRDFSELSTVSVPGVLVVGLTVNRLPERIKSFSQSKTSQALLVMRFQSEEHGFDKFLVTGRILEEG